ncbi:MAG: VOC family protein [Cytophagales bacterium]
MARKPIILVIAACTVLYITSCTESSKKSNPKSQDKMIMAKSPNPVVYFEIPVTDIDRAMKFYTSVFNFTFEKQVIDHNEMALFPFSEESAGVSGARQKEKFTNPPKMAWSSTLKRKASTRP